MSKRHKDVLWERRYRQVSERLREANRVILAAHAVVMGADSRAKAMENVRILTKRVLVYQGLLSDGAYSTNEAIQNKLNSDPINGSESDPNEES